MRRLGPWMLAGAAAVLALGTLRPFRVEVAGRSMEPALYAGDWLIATRAGRRRRGGVVVVADPRGGRDLVKRIAAVPGDASGGRVLGAGEFLVVGDNPAASTDGRTFGPVRGDGIEGVVRLRYWPRPGPVR